MHYPQAHHPRARRSAIFLSIVATIYAAPPAVAFDTALEEVIVTARKREENLQQVPAAINVFTAEDLKDRQIDNLVDMQSTTPNITMSETGGLRSGALSVFIRGIGNDPGFEQGVGVYLDDIYLQRATGLMMDVFDVERIEILKGPQGNLYGRNTIGGAIKYITREPNQNVEASMDGKVGNHGLRQIKGTVSGPLVDGLLYGSFGAAVKRRDGLQTNLYDGSEANEQDGQALRANLKMTPADNLTLKLLLGYTHDNPEPGIPSRVAVDRNAVILQYQRARSLGALPASAPPPDLSGRTGADKAASDVDHSPYRNTSKTAAFTLQWDLNDAFSFKSVSSYREQATNDVFDFDGSAQPHFDSVTKTETEDMSQEFQFNYTGDGFDAVGGLYYSDAESDAHGDAYMSPRFPIPGVLPIAFDRLTSTSKEWSSVRSLAYYGNIDFDLTERWHASVGLRYTKDTREVLRDARFLGRVYTPFGVFGPGQVVNVPIPGGGFRPTVFMKADNSFPKKKTSWDDLSPSLKLAYDLYEDVMVYASVASGFKSGTFNITNPDDIGVVDPEQVLAYSAGLKATLLNQRLQLNTEVFYNDYTDKQLVFITFNGTQLTTSAGNVGKAHTQGVDFEANWLTPVDGLRVDFSVGYLEAVMDEYISGGVDVASHTSLGFSPRWTVGSRLSYTLPVADYGDITLSGEAYYRAKAYTNSPIDRNDPLASTQQTPEYALYNAGVVFRSADQHWRIGLEAKNITDRRVITNTYLASSFVNGGYNDPRQFALSVSYQY